MAGEKTNPPVTCSCGAEAEPYYEEVDIGVGVQRFLTGWECREHGGICGVCGKGRKEGLRNRTACPITSSVSRALARRMRG